MSVMDQLLLAGMLFAGTGMQAGRWLVDEARKVNRAARDAETRTELRRYEQAGVPRYDGAAWVLLFVPAAAHFIDVWQQIL